ncbi:C-type lectin domain family 2 member B-like [Carettochelys insculpta]|uniref:C-type lectin domain family 2 member B-like n=1 Tax=Carettochelys insculpta TaxID=44489 RepID=UPI003EB77A6B
MGKGRQGAGKNLQSREHSHGDLESREKQGCLTMFRNPAGWKVGACILVVFLVMGIALIALAVAVFKSARAPLDFPNAPWCPDGWVGYRGKCYYFSEEEGNWTYSRDNCSSLGASLAVIDAPQERDFMHRYKGPSEHWIGLRWDLNKLWIWVNGREFNNMFEVRGRGECAYLNDAAVGSSWCSSLRRWICSKADSYTERLSVREP